MRELKRGQGRGFTLIELLIVVAIIGILAAIAIPNFLQAQIRAKVSRVHAEFSQFATALESYYVDNNAYPGQKGEPTSLYKMKPDPGNPAGIQLLTPITYITSLPKDPFGLDDAAEIYYDYYIHPTTASYDPFGQVKMPDACPYWRVNSRGPDQVFDLRLWVWRQYDPKNGIVSSGDITRGKYGIGK